MNDENIYNQLAEQLDQYGLGFPPTESGVEIKYLEKLFTEEEARMYLNLSVNYETSKTIAARTGQDLQYVDDILEGMTMKGLLFRSREAGVAKFCIAPFMIGIFESQPKTMDRELAELGEQYMKECFFDHTLNLPVTYMRIIPVNASVDSKSRVHVFEETLNYIKSKDRIAVSECICKAQKAKVGEPCKYPTEVCMAFDWYADHLVDIQVGRYVSQEEALEIQTLCDESGLVTLTGDVTDPISICHCCPCCCVGIRPLSMNLRPADYTVSDYYAEVDSGLCIGCGTCADKCPTAAVVIGTGVVAEVEDSRCIGCGICASHCDAEAIKLKLKPEEARAGERLDSMQLGMKLTELRGKTLSPLFSEKNKK